jgi:hypothetical protein
MRLAVMLLVILLLITGCSGVKTYTFKRDRVDQDMQVGNKGYLAGTPPPAESREGLKRTMIGVDVEIPILPWEEEKKVSLPPRPTSEKVEQPPIEDKKIIMDFPEKKTEPAREPEPPQTIKGEVVEEEEEWIK